MERINIVDVVSRQSVENNTIYTVQLNNADLYLDVACRAKNPEDIEAMAEWDEGKDWDNYADRVNAWEYEIEMPVSSDRQIRAFSENGRNGLTLNMGDIALIVTKVSEYRKEADLELVERLYLNGKRPDYIFIDGECLYGASKGEGDKYSVMVMPRYGQPEEAEVTVTDDNITYPNDLPDLIKNTLPNVEFAIYSLYDKINEELERTASSY